MRVDGQPLPLTAALFACVVGSAVLGACRRDAADAAPCECRCRFLTDFDDLSEQSVTVCAASAAQAGEMARGCAQSAAPAPVQACDCAALPSPSACRPGACEVAERR